MLVMSFLYGEPILCIPRKFILVILLLSGFEDIKCVLVNVDFVLLCKNRRNAMVMLLTNVITHMCRSVYKKSVILSDINKN